MKTQTSQRLKHQLLSEFLMHLWAWMSWYFGAFIDFFQLLFFLHVLTLQHILLMTLKTIIGSAKVGMYFWIVSDLFFWMVKDVCYLDREKEPTNVQPVDGCMLQISCPASSQLSFFIWLFDRKLVVIKIYFHCTGFLFVKSDTTKRCYVTKFKGACLLLSKY